ncbi:enoyl-CoA hydratase-related protein [Neobacillus cucumis]|uniref:enoyl-CoA hydratase-related protein n=1 Tax=Neobacillus cucumis TaxID=1740721 RepID=UPI002E1B6D83|nr:enoyl-CoA hydratase-related protein [Neobacillus cucumis]MED4225543.1 enoyl-CoA hydratase-related protein [Neobacillus cucumis]
MEMIKQEFHGENNEILVVTINRPHAMNAMNTQLLQEMLTFFREQAYNTSLRCVVLTGAGNKAFSAGGDLKERNGMSDEVWRKQHQLIEDKVRAIKDFPVPVIAAVEGYAFGGGFELALVTDILIASETAKFALTEAVRGILPGGGGMQNLPRAIGTRRAKELIFSGRQIDAKLAYEWGAVNRVVPQGKALEASLELAEQIVNSAPISVKMAKTCIDRGTDVDFHTGYSLDIAAYNVVVPTEDRLEGVAAFNEKRKPVWKNR